MVAEFEANIGHQRTRGRMVLAKKNGELKGKQPEAARMRSPFHPPLPPLRRPGYRAQRRFRQAGYYFLMECRSPPRVLVAASGGRVSSF
ncbi:hypothetical protein [Nonomuraea sp. NPDC049725]|uniref:hypothetical protein n=1 Tax=Nonomuraea sp. NPDC049725 TaxID=3154508 RepID=UPI0034486B0D